MNRRIRRVSIKRAKELAVYSKLKKEFIANHPMCHVCHERKATDVHHSKGRIGKLLNATICWCSVCRSCHMKIHNNPKWARGIGLLPPVGQWNNPR